MQYTSWTFLLFTIYSTLVTPALQVLNYVSFAYCLYKAIWFLTWPVCSVTVIFQATVFFCEASTPVVDNELLSLFPVTVLLTFLWPSPRVHSNDQVSCSTLTQTQLVLLSELSVPGVFICLIFNCLGHICCKEKQITCGTYCVSSGTMLHVLCGTGAKVAEIGSIKSK